MKKLFLLLLLAVPAHAESLKFSWTAPTANVDGSPLVLSGYRFYISASEGEYGPYIASISKASTSYTFFVPEKMQNGQKYYATVTAYNNVGESDRSNEVSFVTQPKPQAASALKLVE